MAVYPEICNLSYPACRFEADPGPLLGFGALLGIKAVEVLAPAEMMMLSGLVGRRM